MIASPNSYFTAEEARMKNDPVFIFTLNGDYEIPQDHILDPGQLSLSRPTDFSGLISGDHTLILDNSSGLYSPGRSTFIWDGDTWWRRSIKIELGYRRLGWQGVIDKVTLFEGLITGWEIKEDKDFADDAAFQGYTVEITSRDHISLTAERKIGIPDANFYPNPLVCGQVVWQATDLDNRTFWAATDTITYETGDLSQWDLAYTSGAGAFTAVNTNPHAGTWSGKHNVSGAGDDAYGRQDIGGGSGVDSMHIRAWLRFHTVPVAPINLNYAFMGILNTGAGRSLVVTINNSGQIALDIPATKTVNTTWVPSDWIDEWVQFDLIVQSGTPGYGRLFINNQEVAVMDTINIPKTNIRYGYVGLDAYFGNAETWEIQSDAIEMFNVGYPIGYYLPGGSYVSIDQIYIDTTSLPVKKALKPVPKYFFNWGYEGGFWMGQLLIPGNTLSPDNYTEIASYGLVSMDGLAAKPSGQVSIKATKDSNSHPVDIIEAILTASDLDSYINATSFADAKTARPNDIISGYFDNESASQAISAVTGSMLYDLVEQQGELCLFPYTGAPLVSSVMTLDRSNCYAMRQTIDQSNIKTGISAKWGWYEKNPNLYYIVEDAVLKALLGDQAQELNLAYGSEVSSGDETSTKEKADLLLKRLSGSVESVTCSGFLSLARIELGDGVAIDNININDDNTLIYEVAEKVIDFTNKTVEIKANIYTAEEESMMEVLGTIQ